MTNETVLMSRGGGLVTVARLRRPAAAVLIAVTALSAVPSATAAQECGSTSGPSVTGTPSGTPNTWTFSGVHTSTSGNNVIDCDDLTAGLTLTIEAGAEIGTAATPAHENGIFVDAEGDGDNDLMIINSGTIRVVNNGAQKRGIKVWHNGAGLLKVEHKAGKIVAWGPDSQGISVNHEGKRNTKVKGIHIVSAAEIDLSSATNRRFGASGIYAQTVQPSSRRGGPNTGSDIPIRIEMTGGVIKSPSANAKGIVAVQHLKGDITITVAADAKIGTEDSPIGEYGVFTQVKSGAAGAVSITNAGKIYADKDGIFVEQIGNGDVTVVNDGSIDAVRAGINVEPESAGRVVLKHNAGGKIAVSGDGGTDAGLRVLYQVPDADGERGIMIESSGDISAPAAYGILAWPRNNAAATTRKTPVTIHVKGGAIEAGKDGIYAAVRRYSSGETGETVEHAGGKITVTVDHGAAVTAKADGIYVDSGELDGGMRTQTVTVRGKVMGGDKDDDGNKYAGVHMAKGGTVVIGPRAHVGAASGTAVKANAEGDMAVILEEDAYGLTGRIDGTIVNAAETVFKTRGVSGMETTLSTGQAVRRDGGTKGIYRALQVFVLREAMEGGSKIGYEFKAGSEERQYHARARVYEALPSVLLDLNARAPRMSRGASGGGDVWAVFDAGEGKRQAAVSTTSEGVAGRALAWDFTRWGVASGFDFPAGEDLTFGVSAHHRRGKAAVKHGGAVKASGTGVGASLTYGSADALYVRGWFSYSGFSGIELMSDDDLPGSGNLSRSDVSGSGNAIGLDAGMRTELEGITLTPRGGLVSSSVKVDEFSDLESVAGSGKVSGSGRSVKGRLGVTAEIGGIAAGASVYASLDAERDFSAKRDMTASGTELASKPKSTWGRLGLGGELNLSEDGGTMLSGEAYYATAGGGNSDFGGGLTLDFRF